MVAAIRGSILDVVPAHMRENTAAKFLGLRGTLENALHWAVGSSLYRGFVETLTQSPQERLDNLVVTSLPYIATKQFTCDAARFIMPFPIIHIAGCSNIAIYCLVRHLKSP